MNWVADMKVICSKYKTCTGKCRHNIEHNCITDIRTAYCNWCAEIVKCISSRKLKLKQLK